MRTIWDGQQQQQNITLTICIFVSKCIGKWMLLCMCK